MYKCNHRFDENIWGKICWLSRYIYTCSYTPSKTTFDDHKILKNHGYDDTQIVEITSVVAAFNWANIIADALGTEMES